MSEYIYEHKPSGCDAFGKQVDLPTLVKREEIVRCKDCARWRDVCEWNRFFNDMGLDEPLGFCAWGKQMGTISEPQIIKNADSYNLDTREQLEADVRTHFWHNDWCRSDMVFGWLDRQAAITEREVKERVNFSLIAQTADALFPDYQERIAELTAEVKAQRKRANDAERGVLSKEWYVSRDRYEDDIAELIAERDKLKERVARFDSISSLDGIANLLVQVEDLTAERDEWRARAEQVQESYLDAKDSRDNLQAAIDAMGNGQFYAIYRAKCDECERLKERQEKGGKHDEG